jgi:hypothetical protein
VRRGGEEGVRVRREERRGEERRRRGEEEEVGTQTK